MTGTVTSSGRGGTAAAMAQNEQTAEEQSTLEQQPPERRDHLAWCVVWTVQPVCVYLTKVYFKLNKYISELKFTNVS